VIQLNQSPVFHLISRQNTEPLWHRTSLAELKQKNKKDDYSPRKLALMKVKKFKYDKKIKISDLSEWKGKYQNE